MAATLIFLQIKDKKGRFVVGESTAANYAGQIEIESFSWGVKADHSPKAGSKVSTQAKYETLEVSKYYDRSTTALCQMMAKSVKTEPVPFDFALLSFVDIVFGPKQSFGVPVLEIRLEDGFIEDVTLNAAESGKSMKVNEKVKLSFRQIKITYYTGGKDRSVRGRGFSFEAETASVEE